MPRTERGTPCPTCKDGLTEIVSIVPRVDGERVTEAGAWSCCLPCYKQQWATVYSEQFGGITYDEYLQDNEQKQLQREKAKLESQLAALNERLATA